LSFGEQLPVAPDGKRVSCNIRRSGDAVRCPRMVAGGGALAGRTIYHVHSLGAAGAPARLEDAAGTAAPSEGLGRIEAWLDHVAELGCGGLLLTPVFESSTHGYDTIDPTRIDPRLGDEAAFASLVRSCHERDLVVLLDGVFNHVGRAFPRFEDVLRRGRASEWVEWFRIDFDHDDGDGFRYRTFEGHRELVTLDHENPAVLAWAVDVACRWLDAGADGWRFDAAYAIPTRFLRALTSAVRERHPGAFLFGELIHGDHSAFVAASGLDSTTQYELYKATWSALNDANLFELRWSLERHAAFAASFPPMTFLGNHDVTRLASQLQDAAHVGPALAVLATVPGIPSIYYGDELGWRGVKEHRAGGDDAIRPALPTSFDVGEVFALHQELIALRRARPWLTNATLSIDKVASAALEYTVRGEEGQQLHVALDLDSAAPHFSISEPG
jgi:cyclomaltodextrinase